MEIEVMDAWENYKDQLFTPYNREQISSREIWETKSNEYFVELLYSISRFLGYNFKKSVLKQRNYYPEAFGVQQAQQQEMIEAVTKLLQGKSLIRVDINEKNKNLENSTA